MLSVYSILDKVSKSWLTVSLFNNDDVAKRAFVDLLNSSGFNPHKEDYSIYRLASFDSNLTVLSDGSLSDVENPINKTALPYLVFDGSYLKKESVDE